MNHIIRICLVLAKSSDGLINFDLKTKLFYSTHSNESNNQIGILYTSKIVLPKIMYFGQDL